MDIKYVVVNQDPDESVHGLIECSPIYLSYDSVADARKAIAEWVQSEDNDIVLEDVKFDILEVRKVSTVKTQVMITITDEFEEIA